MKIKNAIQFLFNTWLITLVVTFFYSILYQHSNEFKEFNSNPKFISSTIVVGIISFTGLWITGLISFVIKSLNKNQKKFISDKLVKSILMSIIWLCLFVLITIIFSTQPNNVQQANTKIEEKNYEVTISQSPTTTPIPIPTKIIDPYTSDPNLKDAEWGEAVKTDSGSYTMKVGMDAQMTTANELYEALMSYRNIKGKSRLTWDDKLASYALERATYICQNGSDQHAGFSEFLNNGGYDKLGFRHLGENMSYGIRMSGVHLIEWIYSQSPGHEANQTGQWSHIGVGIFGDCSVLIFGDYKM
ncbi:MAG: hypothetical protein IT416_01955 [Candidatus Pacebacteria bacterium]|nr:hypothetical protein [Candidatus Paceibacterota bacterium]